MARVSAPTVLAPSNNVARPPPAAVNPPTSIPSGAPAGGSPAPKPGGAGGGMGGGQMTPDTAKMKCKNFLATLQRLAEEQPPAVAENVRNLIQGLIDGVVDPETFTTKLQRELNSSPQPCLVPFLKRSLPFLQNSLSSGELTIEGVRAPRTSRPSPMPTIRSVTTVVRPPVALPTTPVASVMRSLGPNMVRTQTVMSNSVQNRITGVRQTQQTVGYFYLLSGLYSI